MRLRILLAVAALATTAGLTVANAEPGYTTANVNMRTGPDIDFPSIGVIPEGDDIYVEGCLRDESWCDVRWGPDRGWVYSEYLAFDYRGQTASLLDLGLGVFRIPIVTFTARDYWGRYYVGRPWYNDRARWYGFQVRPRVGWHAPPPGPRNAGWWRKGYNAPRGMRPPPDRGWRRPAHVERRDFRRDNRGDRRDDRGDRRDDRRDDRGDRRDDRHDRRDDRRDGGR
ncbi:MAG: SH3 domain-containing protein [Hyphomicrobium sp.]|jgi:uncharacterized protein YraI